MDNEQTAGAARLAAELVAAAALAAAKAEANRIGAEIRTLDPDGDPDPWRVCRAAELVVEKLGYSARRNLRTAVQAALTEEKPTAV